MNDEDESYPPEVLQAALTKQVADRMQSLENKIDQLIPKGEVTDKYVNVTDSVKKLEKGVNYYSCSICNYGDQPVYIAVNKWVRPQAPLPAGECENIDFGKRNAIKKIFLKCKPGKSTTVRIHALK